MQHQFQTAISRLPELVQRNAPTMMRRIVARMKADIAQCDAAAKVSHGGLFLKVGEEDLVREFVAAAQETFSARQQGAFDLMLSLEPEDGPAAINDFETSNAAFAALCKSAATLGVKGVERYKSDAFVAALEDAFKRSRMDARATDELMPYARSALNAELQALYEKLDELARGT